MIKKVSIKEGMTHFLMIASIRWLQTSLIEFCTENSSLSSSLVAQIVNTAQILYLLQDMLTLPQNFHQTIFDPLKTPQGPQIHTHAPTFKAFKGSADGWGSRVHRRGKRNLLWFVFFMSVLLCLPCFLCPPLPPCLSFHVLPHFMLHTKPHCTVTLWPLTPRSSTSFLLWFLLHSSRQGSLWGMERQRMDGGQEDGEMKDSACSEIHTGNYANKVGTKDWFDLWRRKRWGVGFRAPHRRTGITCLSFSFDLFLSRFFADTFLDHHLPLSAFASAQVVWSWLSCLKTGCRWSGKRLTLPFRATKSESDRFQVRHILS